MYKRILIIIVFLFILSACGDFVETPIGYSPEEDTLSIIKDLRDFTENDNSMDSINSFDTEVNNEG